MALNHTCTHMQNKCTTHMHLPIQSIQHKMILLTTSSALSFIIYTYRKFLVNGYPYTGTPEIYCICSCLQLVRYMHNSNTYNYSQLDWCNMYYIFHFRLVQEAEQKALISLCDMACTTISYSQGIKKAVVYSQLNRQLHS